MTAKGECQNIIRYYTAWKEGSHQYLLMEYCDYNVSTLLVINLTNFRDKNKWIKKYFKNGN